MPAKPSQESILKSYSLSELLELVQRKSEQDKEEALAETHKQIQQAISGGVSGGAATQRSGGAKRGRKPGPQKRTTGRRGRPPKGSMALKDYLMKVVGNEPMTIDQILSSLENEGYKSQAKDPRRVLYLELKKLVDAGVLQKTGRGTYASA